MSKTSMAPYKTRTTFDLPKGYEECRHKVAFTLGYSSPRQQYFFIDLWDGIGVADSVMDVLVIMDNRIQLIYDNFAHDECFILIDKKVFFEDTAKQLKKAKSERLTIDLSVDCVHFVKSNEK